MTVDDELQRQAATCVSECRADIRKGLSQWLNDRGCSEAERAAVLAESMALFETEFRARFDVLLLKARLQARRPN